MRYLGYQHNYPVRLIELCGWVIVGVTIGGRDRCVVVNANVHMVDLVA